MDHGPKLWSRVFLASISSYPGPYSVTRMGGMRIYKLYDTRSNVSFQTLQSFAKALRDTGGPVLGLDVGTRHIGVAISDCNRMISFPRIGFRRSDARQDIQRLRQITSAEGVQSAVVGMPIAPLGKNNDAFRQFTSSYAESVLRQCGVKHLGFWDESNTSVLAKDAFMRSAKKTQRNDLALRKRMVDAVSVVFRPGLILSLLQVAFVLTLPLDQSICDAVYTGGCWSDLARSA